MPKLTEADMGRIALKCLIQRMADDNTIPNKNTLERDIHNTAKKLGEEPEDLKSFITELLPEIIRVRLGCEGVTLHWKEDDTSK